jgi:AcrR family transcriptional regulator
VDTPDARRFRKTPRQNRSRTTVEAILEAAARLLGEAGPGGATTQQIAHLAGVSIGSLYQYFPGKEALFGALIERAIEADLEGIRRAADEASAMPLAEGVRHLLAAVLELPLTRPRLYAWMMRYLPELGLLPAVQRAMHEGTRETRRVLEAHRDELAGVDLDAAVVVGVGAVRGALELVCRERPELLESEAFLDTMTDLVLGFYERARARVTAPQS